jgi:hypothetical protein
MGKIVGLIGVDTFEKEVLLLSTLKVVINFRMKLKEGVD